MSLQIVNVRALLIALAVTVSVAVVAMACGTERVVEKEVIREVEVPGETVVVTKEVVKTVEIEKPIEVIKEVVRTQEVMVPGETVVVTKEVVKTVEIEKPVEVIREVVREVEVVKEVVVEADRPMVRPVPGAVLTVVVKDVGPPGWHTPTTPAPYNSFDVMLGVQENLLDVAMDGSYQPMIAREWVVNEDGITWTINPGVPWHDPTYGTIDAEDVFWSFENGSREGTVAHFTGWYAADFQNPQVVDRYTVRWDWGEGGPTLRYGLTTRNFTSGTTIENKDYFEQVGEDEATKNVIGTGPYMVTSHVGDDVINLEAVPSHWRNTADWATVRVIEVPEQTTRIALLKNGQGDITDVGIPLLDQIVEEPGIRLVYGAFADKRGVNFMMGGNWQIRTWKDGTPGPPLALQNPWVGDPDKPGDLERARNVRLGLSYAIDREGLNQFILGGAGCLQFVYTIDTCSVFYKDEWSHPYDVEKARELLAAGGFPDGFDMPLWIPTALSDELIEIAEAVVPMWEDLGINITIDKSVYASRRPELFRDEPMLRDVMAAQFGGNLASVETFTDYLGDLIEGKTLWNSGYDYPIGYQIWDNFGIHYSDTEAAWRTLDTYWEFHSHLGELPTIGTVDWTTPWVIGPRIGEVRMVDHGYGSTPELEALHVANP